MKVYEHDIFPIPTRVIDLDEKQQNEIKEYYNDVWKDIPRPEHVKVATTWGMEEQPLDMSPTLVDAITQSLDGYIQRVSNFVSTAYIEDHWLQEYNHGAAHMPHHHPDSIISGVYYIESNNQGSPLVFYNPNNAQHFMNYSTYSNMVECWQGRLILFPSWLLHGVPECRNEDVLRRVIAFNINGNKD